MLSYDAGPDEQGSLNTSGSQSETTKITGLAFNSLISITFGFSYNGGPQPGNSADGGVYVSVAEAPPSLSVTAQDNADGSTDFGPYLVGVPLVNTFTVTPSYNPGTIVAVQYSIDGQEPESATRVLHTNQWTFHPDVGGLSPGNHTLVVTALDPESNVITSSTSTIEMQDSLGFSSLTATYPGGPAAGADATKLRFISGIDLTPTFTGTVTDFPAYYANSTEFPAVMVGHQPQDVEAITWPTLSDDMANTLLPSASFTFMHDVADLQPGPGGQLGQTDVTLLVPTTAGGLANPFYSDAQDLQAIALPTWMGTPTREVFTTASEIQAALGVAGGYAIDLGIGLGASTADLAETSGTPAILGTLFNGLDSSISTEMDFTVYATLDPSAAVIKPKNWSLEASFLGGQNVISQNADLSKAAYGISVTADLNPLTLAAPTQIDITASDIDLLSFLDPSYTFFDLPFGTKPSFKLPVPAPILGFLGLSAEVNLAGDFQAQLYDLSANAELAIDLGSGTPTIDPDLSYVSISAQGSASVTLTAEASLGFNSLLGTDINGTIVSVAVTGKVAADVDLYAQLGLSGPLTSPSMSFDSEDSYASATVSWGVSAALAVLEKANPPSPDILGDATFPLFGNPPVVASLSDPNSATLSGPGQKGDPGYDGVKPTAGPAFDLLGTTQSDSSGVATDGSSSTSTLSIHPPVYATASDLKVDLNVLADQSQLTFGDNFLDVALVDPTGNEVPLSHIDLASFTESANDNPLGFASGWTTIDIQPPTSQLDPAEPYQLVFSLTNDLAGTGQSAAVALDNLIVTTPAASLSVTTPGSSVVSGQLDFGPNTGGSATATVQLENVGNAPLNIEDMNLLGSGFSLAGALPAPFVLDEGDTLDVPVQLLHTNAPASATLQITSDDPNQPTYNLPLAYDGTSLAIAPQATSFSTVPSARNTPISSVNVTFNEPINTSSLSPGALTLTDDGGANLINSDVSLTLVSGDTYAIGGLPGLTTAEGQYTLTINAADLQDQNGNPGTGTLSTSWLMDTTAPTSHVVNSLGTSQTSDSFPVSVAFSDPAGAGGAPASGVSSVALYVSDNNAPFSLYQTLDIAPAASGTVTFTFAGQDRNLYAFHSVAHDAAGNIESKGSNTSEATTSVPDLNPPVTHILASNPAYTWGPFPSSEFSGFPPSSYNNGIFTINWAGADPDANTGVPAGLIALVNIYVQVDGGAPVLIGQPTGGTPNGNGVHSGSITYHGLGDGLPHTYGFYSVGVDDQQLKQYAPQAGPPAPDLTFNNITYTAPLGIQNLVVEKNIAERSFIRYLDVDFNQSLATSPALQTLKAGLAGGSPSSYVELLWYGENLTASSTPQGSVNLFNKGTTASAALNGNDLSINFGPSGITSLLTEIGVKGTGSPTSSFGDGWYALGIDPTGNPSNGQVFWVPFFRLLGSATGDLTVSGPFTTAGTDAFVVYHAEGESGALLNADVNGDGTVNTKDLTETVAANGHSVGATPPEKFPQFQLFAGLAAPAGAVTVPVTQSQVQALLPEAIAAWQAAGLDPGDVRRLESVPVQVGNLGTSILGLEAAGVITINQTAAGNNWYVNASPSSNQAFGLARPGGEEVAGPGSPAAGDVDLLTVLEHELGHVIGLSDNALAGDLMDITLGLGVRRAPTVRDLPPIHAGATAAVTVLPGAAIAPVRSSDRTPGGDKRNEFRSTSAERPQRILVNGSFSVPSLAGYAALASISSTAAGTDEAQGLNVDGGSPTRSVVQISAIAAKPGRKEQGPESALAYRRLPSSLFPQVIRRQSVAAGAFIKPSARE